MKKIFSILMLCLSLGSLHAQETLSIEQCRNLALQHNKDLRSADLSVKVADYNRLSVRGLFCPDFSLSGTAIYGTSSGAFLEELGLIKDVIGKVFPSPVLDLIPNQIDYKIGWIFNGSVQMKQPLFMGGKIIASYKMSKLAVDLYRQNLRKTKADIIEEADLAYANVIKARELKKVADQYLALLEELDRNVQSAVRNGMKLENDHMKVVVKINEARLSQRRAQNAIRLATMNLCHVVGLPLNSNVEVDDTYPRVGDAVSLNADITSRPEYAMLDYKAQIAAENIKAVRADLLPQLAMLASYGYTNGVEVLDTKLLNNWGFTGGVTLNIPIYHFGERTYKLKAAKLQAEQARLELENKAEMMQLELSRNANLLEESRLEVELTESSLLQAENSMQISDHLYKAGTETLSDHLESQLLWQQAYQRKVEAYYQQYLSSVAYLKSAGNLVSQ